MCTVDVTIGERYTALSANQRAGPGPAPAVLHHPRPMAAPSCSPHRLGSSSGHCFIITTATDWRMICSLELVREVVRKVVRVAAKLPVVPRPGAEAGRGAAAFPPHPPPPAVLQCCSDTLPLVLQPAATL